MREELDCETAHDLLTAFRNPADWTEFYNADIKLTPRVVKAEATSQTVSTVAEALAAQASEDPVAPAAVPAVRREWVMTMRSKCLHVIKFQADGIYTACKWRKGANARKPIDEERILWRGDADAARSTRIQMRPDSACGL